MTYLPDSPDKMLDKQRTVEGVRVLRRDYGHAYVEAANTGERFWTPLEDLAPIRPLTPTPRKIRR